MYIETIEIENLRSIEHAELKLRAPRPSGILLHGADEPLPNVNLLLGDNGAGKTTVLKAMALALLGPVISHSGFRPYYLVRRNKKSSSVHCEVALHPQDQAGAKRLGGAFLGSLSLSVTVERRGDYESVVPNTGDLPPQFAEAFFYEDTPAFFVVAYGATRRVDDAGSFVRPEASRSRSARYQRVAGLFENQISLVPLSSWLNELRESNKGRFTQVQHLLNALLPREASFTGNQIEGDFVFRVNAQDVPFGALSDGYRAYISWLSDLLYHIVKTCPPGARLDENRGLVLVDEVDLHLHPNWQRSIIHTLSTCLPYLQFVFTSHSPIVASSLHHENVFVMQADESGASSATQLKERIFGLSADQALESSYFSVPTTRSEQFVHEVSRATRTLKLNDPASALELMNRLIGRTEAGALQGLAKSTVTKKPTAKRTPAGKAASRKAIPEKKNIQASKPKARYK